MTAHVHEELEAGHELDRALRSAMMMLGQALERRSRNATDRARAQAAAERDRARELDRAHRDLEAAAREARRDQQLQDRDAARSQERIEQTRQWEQRQQTLAERDAARQVFTPWTREGAVERGDRLAASRAWERACEWSDSDPVAREAAAMLQERIIARFDQGPAAIVRSVDPQLGYPTGVPAGRMSLVEAVELASKHAPHYYHRSDAPGFGRIGKEPVNDAQRALIADMQEWARTGQIPFSSRQEQWAQHLGVDLSSGDVDALSIWNDTRGLRTFQEYGAQVAAMRDAGMSTDQLAAVMAGYLPNAADYRELLDVEAARAATDQEVIAAYSAARLDAAEGLELDPSVDVGPVAAAEAQSLEELQQAQQTAAAAAAQLERELTRRWGQSPGTYLADMVTDQRIAAVDQRRRDEDAAVAAPLEPPQPADEQDQAVEWGEPIPSASATPEVEQDRDMAVPEVAEPALDHGEEISERSQIARGIAPSKATTPGERAHRERAWSIARDRFASENPQLDTAQVGRAWASLNSKEQFGRYWDVYDTDAARGNDPDIAPIRRANDQAPPTAGPIAADRSHASQARREGPQQSWSTSRERVLELNERAAQYFESQLTPGTRGHDYLTGRVGAPVVDGGPFRFGYAPPGWRGLATHLREQGATDTEIVDAGLGAKSSIGSTIDVFRDRAMLAVRDEAGSVVGFVGRDLSGQDNAPKYTNTGRTPAYTKGDHLFGLYEAAASSSVEAPRIARVEGPFDAIAVTAAGGGRIHGVAPLGTALSSTQVEQLSAHARSGAVWLGNDSDTAGMKATASDYWQLADRQVNARLLSWPNGKDPAELWANNPDQLRELLASPDAAPSAGLVVMDEEIRTHRAGLLDGDSDVFEQIRQTQMDVENVMGNDLDRDLLNAHVNSRLDALRADEALATEQSAALDDRRVEALQDRDSARSPEGRGNAQEEASHLTGREQEALARRDRDRAQEPAAAPSRTYDRAALVELAALDDNGQRIVRANAHGYSRSIGDMLNDTAGAAGRRAKPERATNTQGQNRRKGLGK